MLSHARVRAWHEWKVKQLAFRDFARRENVRRYNRQRGFIINPYAFGGVGDPDFASVISLAHFNDAPDAFTGPFVDQIANRSPGWTRNSVGAQTTSGVVKYGARSLNCANVGVYNADHADWDFGSGDFAVEGWLNLAGLNNAFGNAHAIASKGWASGVYAPWFIFVGTGVPYFYASLDGATWGVALAGGSALSTSVWYHFAATRSGTSFRLFIDGTQTGSTATASGALTTNASDAAVGGEVGGSTLYGCGGHIDDYRATKGIPRYTSNFTAPAAQFPDS
jgi:hypothetical protein